MKAIDLSKRESAALVDMLQFPNGYYWRQQTMQQLAENGLVEKRPSGETDLRWVLTTMGVLVAEKLKHARHRHITKEQLKEGILIRSDGEATKLSYVKIQKLLDGYVVKDPIIAGDFVFNALPAIVKGGTEGLGE